MCAALVVERISGQHRPVKIALKKPVHFAEARLIEKQDVVSLAMRHIQKDKALLLNGQNMVMGLTVTRAAHPRKTSSKKEKTIKETMKIIKAIKVWYRGKPKPPRKTRLMVGGQVGPEFEMKQEGIIRSLLAIVLAAFFGFFGREWRTLLATSLSLTAIFIALSANKRVVEIKAAEPSCYECHHRNIK